MQERRLQQLARRSGARRLGLAGLLSSAAAAAVAAGAAPVDIAHCVAGPPLHLGAASERAMLDNADRDDVQAAILARYPALAADGFALRQILLWQQPAGKGWLYVSLLDTPDHPEIPCFTATFEADPFPMTPALTQKYFFVGKART